jgi:hypothetical protein
MANDFSNDPRVKALYRFENNLNDSKGGNHLTDHNTVGFTSADKKEGSYAADFEKDNAQWASRPDSQLDAGFPLKSGDTTKKISVCFWIKPESNVIGAYVIAKYDTNGRRSFAIIRDNFYMKLYCGYNNGDSAETIDTGYSINNGEWYHVGVSVDGVNKTAYIRIFRASNSTVTEYYKTFTNELNVEDADFTIGARHDGNSTYAYDGLLDEVVVFNDLVTAFEIDAIRSGTYTYPMAQARVEAAGAQVAYTDQNAFVQVNSAGLMAAYGLFAEIGEVQVDAAGLMVAYGLFAEIGEVQVNAAGLMVAYGAPPPKRAFPVPNPRVRWQSHPKLRKFPVVN